MPEESKFFMMPSNNGAAGSCGVMAGEKDAGTVNKKSANESKNPIFNNIPPPKTDKPRPHRCGTCLRGFARLEHLKRHERSHTKEKPFECPECARCFARRDLLLRHQQKLHMTTTPLARARNRRESTTTTPTNGLGRVRKNSLANGRGAAVSMRPRANTISHVDENHVPLTNTSIPPVATTTSAVRPGPTHTHNRHSSLAELSLQNDFYHQYSGLSTNMSQRVINHGLSRIDTNNFNGADYGMGMRTAPPMAAYNPEFDFERFVFGPNSTINPNALHYSDSPHSLVFDALPTYQNALGTDMNPAQLDENCDWMNNFENNLSFHENSSPSLISASSPSGISDIMLDGSNNPAANSTAMWPSTMLAPRLMNSNSFSVDPGNAGFHDMMGHGQPQSPLHNHLNENEPFFSTPPRPSIQNNFEGLELN